MGIRTAYLKSSKFNMFGGRVAAPMASAARDSSLSNFVTMDAPKPEIGFDEAEDPGNVSLYVGVSCGRALRPLAA
jgi:hypothetical protein